MLTGVYTFDHRFGDAGIATKFIRIVKAYVEDPEGFDSNDYEETKPWAVLDKEERERK